MPYSITKINIFVNEQYVTLMNMVPVFLHHLSLQWPFYVFPPYDHSWYLIHLALQDLCCFAPYSLPEPEDMLQTRQPKIQIIILSE